jgi:branched-chain amino acid transport system ATP-binding protein
MLGVVDPTLYGAPVSLGLFVAVLIGSRVGFFGPFVGAGVIGGLPLLAGALIPSVATAPARGVAVAGLTIVALVLGLGTGSIDTTPPDSAPPDATPIGAGGRQPAAARAPRGRTRASRRQLLVAGALCRSFGGVRALDSVDLTVREGEIHAIIGPNGSGKSTLLKCLTGAIEVDSGHVTLGAYSLDGLSESERSRAGVVRTFQRVVLMPGMSAREHVELGLSARAADSGWLLTLLKTPAHRGSARARLEAADSILETFGLARWADSIPPAMPGGRQRLLQVATAAATGPKILLLDEPAAGMGTAELEILAGALGRLRDMGVTMVLVEHNISFVARLAERVTVLDGGRTLAEGTPRQVVADSRVRAAYLGGSTANVP